MTIAGVQAWVVTENELVYVQQSPSTLSLCRRPLANLTTVTSCAPLMAAVPGQTYVVDLTDFGPSLMVRVLRTNPGGSALGFLVIGTTVVPAFADENYFFQGDARYYVASTAPDFVPSIRKLNGDGSTSPAFALPMGAVSRVNAVAVAPDRVLESDNRDGSTGFAPAWSRPVSIAGFGGETSLPKRAQGLITSAGRTAVKGSEGLFGPGEGGGRHVGADL